MHSEMRQGDAGAAGLPGQRLWQGGHADDQGDHLRSVTIDITTATTITTIIGRAISYTFAP